MSADLDWDSARALAATASEPLPAVALPVREAVGAVLVEAAIAEMPVPHYDSSAMDGWAVAGEPPWRVVGGGPLAPGAAVIVVTGGALPPGTTGVVPLEAGEADAGVLRAPPPAVGAHVRSVGEEAPVGTPLVPAGVRLTAVHAALLGVAGTDVVRARPAPSVAAILTGDEVVTGGRPGVGRVRDAFDPLLPTAVTGLKARALQPVRVGDVVADLAAAIRLSPADVLVTTGGTGRSGVDRLRSALQACGAEPVFDGVAMRPGHPALLSRLPDGRPLLGLPGNPLAAVLALLSFLPAVLAGRLGLAEPPLAVRAVSEPFVGRTGVTLLLPCRATDAGLRPVSGVRPNMLRGLADADLVAVVPPAGAAAGHEVRILPVPW